MSEFVSKKLLVLGGKPIGSIELVSRAKDLGCYVIVSDNLPKEKSPAKLIADEYWDISTADVDKLVMMCQENRIDGVITAVHEFNINRLLDVCEKLKKPCYCHKETWKYCDNKQDFKAMCEKYGVPVALQYRSIQSLTDTSVYPVIVKPVDGSGSRGFKKCFSYQEVINGIEHAKQFSPTGQVLIEEFVPFNSVIIHYTLLKGKCYFSGMSDKYSVSFMNTGASVMGLQTFPSKGESIYLNKLDGLVTSMFENENFTEGPVWIEAFYDGAEKFVFNEMGYRFGGSLTYYPVKHFYSVDQLDQLIYTSLGIECQFKFQKNESAQNYCILPLHLKSGIINNIEGVESVLAFHKVKAVVPVHFIGDVIEDWGSAQQVFCYVHFVYDSSEDMKETIKEVMKNLKVKDSSNKDLLFMMFETDNI